MLNASRLLQKLKGGTNPDSLIRNLGITFGENVLTKGLNFLIILMLTRSLGPEDYGKYSFVFITVALCSALFDFGMENTAVRFSAKDAGKNQAIFGLYLIAKLTLLFALVLFFMLGGQWVFTLMDKSAVIPFLPYLIAGLIGESLFFVNDTYLQAVKRFQLRATLNIARYAVSMLYIWMLLTNQTMHLNTVMMIYLIPLAFSCLFLGKYIGFIRSYIRETLSGNLLADIFQYEKWMFTLSIATNLLGRIDFFMLGFWVGFHQLGIYNAAFQLCAIVSFLPVVLGKVLLPTLAGQDEKQIFATTAKVVRGTLQVAAVAVLAIPLVPWVVPFLLGEEYTASVTVLQILLMAFIAGFLSMPYEQALYALGRPKVLSACRYMQLGLIVLLNVLSIPLFGIYAAAVVTLMGRVLYLMVIRRQYQQYEMKPAVPVCVRVGVEP